MLPEVYAQILDPATSTPRRFDLLMGEARSLWGKSALHPLGGEEVHVQAWALFSLGLSTLILLETGDLQETFEGRFTPRAHTFYGRWWREFGQRGGGIIAHWANPDTGLTLVRCCMRRLIRLRRMLGPPPWDFHAWPSVASLNQTPRSVPSTQQGVYALIRRDGTKDVCKCEPISWKPVEAGVLHPGGKKVDGKWWTRWCNVHTLLRVPEAENVPLWRPPAELEGQKILSAGASPADCLQFQEEAELRLATGVLASEMRQASAFALRIYRLFPDPRRTLDHSRYRTLSPIDPLWVAALPLRVHAHLHSRLPREVLIELTPPSARRLCLDYWIAGLRARGWGVWEYEGSKKVLVMPPSWDPGENRHQTFARLSGHLKELREAPDKPAYGMAAHTVVFKYLHPAEALLYDRNGVDIMAIP